MGHLFSKIAKTGLSMHDKHCAAARDERWMMILCVISHICQICSHFKKTLTSPHVNSTRINSSRYLLNNDHCEIHMSCIYQYKVCTPTCRFSGFGKLGCQDSPPPITHSVSIPTFPISFHLIKSFHVQVNIFEWQKNRKYKINLLHIYRLLYKKKKNIGI